MVSGTDDGREAEHCHRRPRGQRGRGPGRVAVARGGARVSGVLAPFGPAGEGRRHDTSILVMGGTGTLGRPVAQRLRDAGASVTVLSRHPGETAEGIRYAAGDLSTGEGIEAALRGAEVIVQCAGSRKGDALQTRTLGSAAKH